MEGLALLCRGQLPALTEWDLCSHHPKHEQSRGLMRSSPNLWLHWRGNSLRNKLLPRERDLVEATVESEIYLCSLMHVPGLSAMVLLGKMGVYLSSFLKSQHQWHGLDMLCPVKGRTTWAKALARSTPIKGFHCFELEELARRTWTKSYDSAAPRTCTGKKATSIAILKQENYISG